MRDYLQEEAENLARTMTGDDAELRAAVTVSSILGITIAHRFLHLAALDDVDDEGIAALTNAWLSPQ